ncbi:aminotransferase class V-fold PLP-dependent enzyme [Dolosicoccus paucivorans]|uniref:cysteine desulfurase n=1 Tax=Dolosicoccus paucivorans TaxID=84521 RepID=A0A2N6SQ20_9LACT|nr:SufS family cysteine desulfurase [Dolosicoccus paucivorans]PMB84545.1 cysteine desulfurase [Dolosicoccus paucivorans]PMC59160.1 cysteine desulfurase [Dolosicoccus paucivorans]
MTNSLHELKQQMEATRNDFPILDQKINDEPLIYLDNGATTQKPLQVIEAIRDFYLHDNANVNRGVHTLGNRATNHYEKARRAVKEFINATREQEIIFTSGTTESINYLVFGWAKHVLNPGDKILLTEVEHHANLVPWQELAKDLNVELEFAPLTPDGTVDIERLKAQLTPQHRIFAVNHVSNVLGQANDIKKIGQLMHQHQGFVVVDGAQSVPHMAVDVQDLDADFYVFSAHKMLGPTGIGVLYGKYDLLNELTPQKYGGDMITTVDCYHSQYADLPHRLEGGTPHIAGAVGLKAALDYLNALSMDNIHRYEQALSEYLLKQLVDIPFVQLYGSRTHKESAIFSFNIEGVHPHDAATAFDQLGIAVRAGHHCAQPLMKWLGAQSTLRASFYFYNTFEEADRFIEAIHEIKEFFGDGFI